jgi:hypothetical protein
MGSTDADGWAPPVAANAYVLLRIVPHPVGIVPFQADHDVAAGFAGRA